MGVLEGLSCLAFWKSTAAKLWPFRCCRSTAAVKTPYFALFPGVGSKGRWVCWALWSPPLSQALSAGAMAKGAQQVRKAQSTGPKNLQKKSKPAKKQKIPNQCRALLDKPRNPRCKSWMQVLFSPPVMSGLGTALFSDGMHLDWQLGCSLEAHRLC